MKWQNSVHSMRYDLHNKVQCKGMKMLYSLEDLIYKDTTLFSRLLLGLFVFLLILANLIFSICIHQSLVNVLQIMFGIVCVIELFIIHNSLRHLMSLYFLSSRFTCCY